MTRCDTQTFQMHLDTHKTRQRDNNYIFNPTPYT